MTGELDVIRRWTSPEAEELYRGWEKQLELLAEAYRTSFQDRFRFVEPTAEDYARQEQAFLTDPDRAYILKRMVDLHGMFCMPVIIIKRDEQ